MLIEREITIVHIPSWYRIALHGSVFGLIIASIVMVILIGWWGLLVLLLSPALLLFRLVTFSSRTITMRIDGSLSVVEHDRLIEIPLDEVRVRERSGSTVALEVTFPYRGAMWRGVIARKDAPDAIVSSGDDPALYARIRATLRSR